VNPDEAEGRIEEAVRGRGGGFAGVWVTGLALAALVGVVAITVLTLPGDQKGQNIIAIATASFGVIGAIVGGYFGVSSANRAAEIVGATQLERDAHAPEPPGTLTSRSGPPPSAGA
jgi:hypothetical protein